MNILKNKNVFFGIHATIFLVSLFFQPINIAIGITLGFTALLILGGTVYSMVRKQTVDIDDCRY